MDRFGQTHNEIIKDDLAAVTTSLATGTLCTCPICNKVIITVASFKQYLSKDTARVFTKHMHQHAT
jgi:hypothetical protein